VSDLAAQMLDTFVNWSAYFSRFFKSLKYTTWKQMVETVWDSTETLAEARLALNFALIPLIKDLVNIFVQAELIIDDVQKKFAQAGEDYNPHYSSSIVITDTTVPGAGMNYWRSWGDFEMHTFTATIRGTYDYSLRTATDAFTRYWGLDLNAGVIWEAIPFSFLIDYFFKVGDAIRYSTLDPNVVLGSYEYCESILNTYSSGYVYTGDPKSIICLDGKIVTTLGACITGRTGSTYERLRTTPDKRLAPPKLHIPSGAQGWNMAALARCFMK
jgi:hypothetical protein